MKKSPWISIEGVDGAGKSSHIEHIVNLLKEKGFDVVSTREPGGTNLGERLRDEMLNTPMSLQTEVLLAFSSRAEHMDKIIRPALSSNKAVVCDRFTDSTYAYQGYGHGYSLDQITMLENMVHGDIQPDLTLVFDLPVEESMRRLGKTGKTPDRFESQPIEYFQRVRQGYLDRAEKFPERICLIDSLPSWDNVHKNVTEIVERFVEDFQLRSSQSNKKSYRP